MKRSGYPAVLAGLAAVLGALDMRVAVAASDYPSVLPPEAGARRALEESPQIQASQEQVRMADARRRQLRAGTHEWTIGVTGQKRTDPAGVTFSEQSYELARGWRWLGKAGLDRALGEQAARVGEYAFGDAWHEAARALLAGWFDWLRAEQVVKVLEAQVAVLQEQLQKVQSRVRAGDAPRLEQSLAQTELDKGVAARLAARLRAGQSELELKRVFPALVLLAPAVIDMPELLQGTDAEWTKRILDHNHEVELARGQYEQARLAASRAARDRVADPTVALRYSNNLDGNDRLLGVVVTMPLGGARRSAEHAYALGAAGVAGQMLRETQLKVQAAAQNAVLAMRSTHAQWLKLHDVAEQSAASATAMERGYVLGEFTIAELLAARRLSLEAALTAETARLDALESAARLRLDAHEIWAVRESHGGGHHPDEVAGSRGEQAAAAASQSAEPAPAS